MCHRMVQQLWCRTFSPEFWEYTSGAFANCQSSISSLAIAKYLVPRGAPYVWCQEQMLGKWFIIWKKPQLSVYDLALMYCMVPLDQANFKAMNNLSELFYRNTVLPQHLVKILSLCTYVIEAEPLREQYSIWFQENGPWTVWVKSSES